MILRWAMHFASGNSLFSGIAIILCVWFLTSYTRFKQYRRMLRLLMLLAVVLVALSSTPLAWWIYAAWLTSLLWWMWTTHGAQLAPDSPRLRRFASQALVGMCFIVAIVEVATFFPDIPNTEHQVMYVIGDSITAGLNEDDLLWPTVLSESRGVHVVNLAEPGAMADSAWKQVQRIPEDASGIVLIEIGGNDMLSGRSAAHYGRDLDTLLKSVSSPNRTVVLMELPLAPFHHLYGREQRRLAREHRAVLIPKREFARVLGLADGTLDGIHLSAEGQRLMADILWKYIGSLYQSDRPTITDN
ncbi:MAG: hypothetical protein KF861_08975 [Planctomycetaceae bacterium]|nr:hypothetical protein [Planctomycetaceae bacterium]